MVSRGNLHLAEVGLVQVDPEPKYFQEIEVEVNNQGTILLYAQRWIYNFL